MALRRLSEDARSWDEGGGRPCVQPLTSAGQATGASYLDAVGHPTETRAQGGPCGGRPAGRPAGGSAGGPAGSGLRVRAADRSEAVRGRRLRHRDHLQRHPRSTQTPSIRLPPNSPNYSSLEHRFPLWALELGPGCGPWACSPANALHQLRFCWRSATRWLMSKFWIGANIDACAPHSNLSRN